MIDVADHVALARSRLGRLAHRLPPHVDVDDLLAEALLAMAVHAPRHDPARGTVATFLVPWIDGAIREQMRNDARRASRYEQRPVPERTSPATVDVVCSRETARMVRDAVSRLPGREKAVVEDVDFGCGTQKQCARRWGVTEGRVSQIRTKALARLREELVTCG